MTSQYEKGHLPNPSQEQPPPGVQHQMDPAPASTKLPTEDSGYQTYRAAGKLEGKRALITGGDSGIGRATALLFAMEGADVAIVYLAEEEKDAQDTRTQVEGKGRKCVCIQADLTRAEECRRAVEEGVKALGGLEILVNNAAYQMVKNSIDELSEDQWDHTFKTNIYAYYYMAKYALPHLRKTKGSTIINMASVNHYIGRPDLLDYTSTKGAIVAFTRGLSNQVVGEGIRVNAIAPGPVWTPLVVATMGKQNLEQFNATPMGRPGQPTEIATCCVFLASQDSSFISGQTLHPNGGTMVNG
ncbi:NAD(P)-binding protein [Schizophyllum commune Tattone D]|nr:NAD(P)-binding protein [Schizophyllum commune Tattone D]